MSLNIFLPCSRDKLPRLPHPACFKYYILVDSLVNVMTKSYDKIEYWSDRNEPNSDKAVKLARAHSQWVQSFISSKYNILEYGPGVGRMVELYINNSSINFYDITFSYQNRLIDRCKEFGLVINKFIIDDSGQIKTPFKDHEFDVVTCFEVFLHSSHTEIKDLMLELARISHKVVVITWYEGGNVLQSNHCFTRDYRKIINDNNLNLLEWKENLFPNQVAFVYR